MKVEGFTTQIDLSYTSPAAASTVANIPVKGLGIYRSMFCYAGLTGATGGALDVYIQTSPDGGTTWVDYAHFTQKAAGAALTHQAFTVSKGGQQTTLTTVGVGTVPALAVSVLGGDFGDMLRVVSVAGAGTSAGAAQILKLFFSG